MNCELCIDLLQQRLDGVPGGRHDPDLTAHLAGCDECRARYAAARKLEDGLRRLHEPIVPLTLGDRLTAQLLGESRSQVRRRWLAYAGSAAAAVLLLTLGGTYFFGRNSKPPQPIDDPPPSLKTPPSTEPVHLRETVVEAGSAVAQMTTRAADETLGPTRQLLTKLPTPVWRERPMPEQPVHPLQEVGHGVSAGLEPVATSAQRAYGMLMHNLAPIDPDEKGALR